MSREAPLPPRARKSRSLSSALDDFAEEKKATNTGSNAGTAAVFILVAVVGTAALFGGGYVLFANVKFEEPPPEEEKKSRIAYISMDEIKANAAKRAEATGAIMPKSSVRRDVHRTDAKGSSETIDGIQAQVIGVAIEREYRVGILIYRRRNPLLRITVAFQMSALGQTRAYDFDADMFPLAKMIDEVDRPYPQLETGGFERRYSGVVRFDKPEILTFYFDPPVKTRPLYLDIKHPAIEGGQRFRFFISDDMYDVRR